MSPRIEEEPQITSIPTSHDHHMGSSPEKEYFKQGQRSPLLGCQQESEPISVPPPEHQDGEGGQKIPPNPSAVTPPVNQTPKTDSDDGHYKHYMKGELRKQQKQKAQQQQQNQQEHHSTNANVGTRKLPPREVANNPALSKPPLAKQPGVQPNEQIEQANGEEEPTPKTFAAFQKDFDSERFDKLAPHD